MTKFIFGESRGELTIAVNGALQLDAPFSLGYAESEHGDAHCKKHDGCDELKCP